MQVPFQMKARKFRKYLISYLSRNLPLLIQFIIHMLNTLRQVPFSSLKIFERKICFRVLENPISYLTKKKEHYKKRQTLNISNTKGEAITCKKIDQPFWHHIQTGQFWNRFEIQVADAFNLKNRKYQKRQLNSLSFMEDQLIVDGTGLLQTTIV